MRECVPMAVCGLVILYIVAVILFEFGYFIKLLNWGTNSLGECMWKLLKSSFTLPGIAFLTTAIWLLLDYEPWSPIYILGVFLLGISWTCFAVAIHRAKCFDGDKYGTRKERLTILWLGILLSILFFGLPHKKGPRADLRPDVVRLSVRDQWKDHIFGKIDLYNFGPPPISEYRIFCGLVMEGRLSGAEEDTLFTEKYFTKWGGEMIVENQLLRYGQGRGCKATTRGLTPDDWKLLEKGEERLYILTKEEFVDRFGKICSESCAYKIGTEADILNAPEEYHCEHRYDTIPCKDDP